MISSSREFVEDCGPSCFFYVWMLQVSSLYSCEKMDTTQIPLIVIAIAIMNHSILPLWTFPLRMKIVGVGEITIFKNGCVILLYLLEFISCIKLMHNMHHRHISVSMLLPHLCRG